LQKERKSQLFVLFLLYVNKSSVRLKIIIFLEVLFFVIREPTWYIFVLTEHSHVIALVTRFQC